MDRLLPYNLEVVYVPGRMLGKADYLSRHLSPCEGTIASTVKLFNDWFTVNVVRDSEKGFENAFYEKRQPIKNEQLCVGEKQANMQESTVEGNRTRQAATH